MKNSRADQEAIAALMYENYNDMSFESDPGMDFQEDEGAMVIQMKPVGAVEPEKIDKSVITVELKKLAEYSKRLCSMCQGTEFSPWMIMKVVKASDYVSDVYHNLEVEADFANSGFEQAESFNENFEGHRAIQDLRRLATKLYQLNDDSVLPNISNLYKKFKNNEDFMYDFRDLFQDDGRFSKFI